MSGEPFGMAAGAAEAGDSGDARDTLSRVPRRTRWTAAELLAEQFPEPRWSVPGPGSPSRVCRSATGLNVSRDTATSSAHPCNFPSETSGRVSLRITIHATGSPATTPSPTTRAVPCSSACR